MSLFNNDSEKIPLAFKEYATKHLASKNATAITYATNNKIKLDDENLKIGAEINKVNFNNNLNTNLDVILSQPGVPANIKANNVLLNFNDKDADSINNHYGHFDLGVYARVVKSGLVSVQDQLDIS